MEQVGCELLWPCPPCSDLVWALQCTQGWLFHLRKECPHPSRASFQLLELPEVVYHSLVFVLMETSVWGSRGCGTAAAWICVCLNSYGSDALSLLFTSITLLCILWIAGSGTGFSPGMVKPSFPQHFINMRLWVSFFFLIGLCYK